MTIKLLLLGVAAVLIALALAGAAAFVTEGVDPAKAAFAGELFTIPLAASVRV